MRDFLVYTVLGLCRNGCDVEVTCRLLGVTVGRMNAVHLFVTRLYNIGHLMFCACSAIHAKPGRTGLAIFVRFKSKTPSYLLCAGSGIATMAWDCCESFIPENSSSVPFSLRRLIPVKHVACGHATSPAADAPGYLPQSGHVSCGGTGHPGRLRSAGRYQHQSVSVRTDRTCVACVWFPARDTPDNGAISA